MSSSFVTLVEHGPWFIYRSQSGMYHLGRRVTGGNPSWEELATLFCGVMLSKEFEAARAEVLPDDLRNGLMWLVDSDHQLSAEHEDYFDEMCRKYLPEMSGDKGFQFDRPTISGVSLVEEEDGYALRDSKEKNAELSGALMVRFAALILSDVRTEAGMPEMYSPFLGLFVGKDVAAQIVDAGKAEASISVQPTESLETAQPVTTTVQIAAVSEQDWATTVRRRFRSGAMASLGLKTDSKLAPLE